MIDTLLAKLADMLVALARERETNGVRYFEKVVVPAHASAQAIYSDYLTLFDELTKMLNDPIKSDADQIFAHLSERRSKLRGVRAEAREFAHSERALSADEATSHIQYRIALGQLLDGCLTREHALGHFIHSVSIFVREAKENQKRRIREKRKDDGRMDDFRRRMLRDLEVQRAYISITFDTLARYYAALRRNAYGAPSKKG